MTHGKCRAHGFAALLLALMASTALPSIARDAAIETAAHAAERAARGHRLVIVGELHGTREIPLLVGSLVERFARTSPVLLALEIPQAEQAALDAALADGDGARARRGLRARAWWRRSDAQHDGRRSVDMLDLVERMRRLRVAGRDIALLAYDADAEASRADPAWRDRVMAANVRRAYAARPSRRVVMLAGNFHAFLRIPPYMQAPPIVPAGQQLADLDPASLRIGADTGVFWACVDARCDARAATPAGPAEAGEYTAGITLPRFTVRRLVTVPPP